jgi:hypothetical protein
MPFHQEEQTSKTILMVEDGVGEKWLTLPKQSEDVIVFEIVDIV